MTLASGSFLKILMADDDPDYHDLFRQVVVDVAPKARLESVFGFEEMFDYLEKHTKDLPDMIFLDINMPVRNGKECLSEIRKNKFLDKTPVIMFSISNYYKDVDETFSLGANLYVTKIVFFNDPVNILNKILNIDWKEYFPPTKEKFLMRK